MVIYGISTNERPRDLFNFEDLSLLEGGTQKKKVVISKYRSFI